VRFSLRGVEERAGLTQIFPTWASTSEKSAGSSRDAFLASPVVFAVIQARQKVFSEVRFVWRRTGTDDTWTSPGLRLLRTPWPGGTTTELLSRMELDASLSGNAYVVRASLVGGPDQLQVLPPDRVQVESDGRVKTGFLYWPDGVGNGKPVPLLLQDVAHWAPVPHPHRNWVGAAWVDAVLPEIRNDIRMTQHQTKFFSNAATPNAFVKVEGTMTPEAKELLRGQLERRYSGVANAYKTLVMDQGADFKVVGADMMQMDFVNVQKSVEGRISSAGGVPPIVVAFKAGLDAATYSNYAMAMRAFADHTIRPAWNSVAAALGQVVRAPNGSELWFNDSQVAALRQDAKDVAEIKKIEATTIESYIRSGYTAETAIDAVMTGDLSRLEHTGLTSVQLLPPGEGVDAPQTTGPDDSSEVSEDE
jgi:HK97 family phage portal protein